MRLRTERPRRKPTSIVGSPTSPTTISPVCATALSTCSDEAARLYLRDEMDLAEERALHSVIVSPVKAAAVWWKQLAIPLAMSIVAPCYSASSSPPATSTASSHRRPTLRAGSRRVRRLPRPHNLERRGGYRLTFQYHPTRLSAPKWATASDAAWLSERNPLPPTGHVDDPNLPR